MQGPDPIPVNLVKHDENRLSYFVHPVALLSNTTLGDFKINAAFLPHSGFPVTSSHSFLGICCYTARYIRTFLKYKV